MSNSTPDAGIPVLTEVIPVLTEVIEIHAVDEDAAPLHHEAESQETDVVDVPDIDGWLNEEWNRLERKIGGRILHQVMSRLESDIENRVRDALADVLQMTVESMAADLKQNLQHTLQEAISQAVKEEISNMQTAKE